MAHKTFAGVVVGTVVGFLGWCIDGRVAWFPVGIVCVLCIIACNEANKASIARHEAKTQQALDRAWDEKGWGE